MDTYFKFSRFNMDNMDSYKLGQNIDFPTMFQSKIFTHVCHLLFIPTMVMAFKVFSLN